MSRTLTPRGSVRLLSLLTATILCLAPVLAARAASYVYGSQQRTINAGVLINGKASTLAIPPASAPTPAVTVAPDPSPYVFYLFNLRADVKPFGWNVVNPQAPSVVSVSTAQRWVIDPAASPPTSYYNVGQAVRPNMAAYWEVPLSDTSADQLAQYDVLYLPLGTVDTNGNPVPISPSDNEKLRRFVDGGGQLWIEADPHTKPALANPATSSGFFGVSIASSAIAGPALPGISPNGPYLRHPILSQPFLMSYDDLFSMGLTPGYTVTDTPSLFGNALLAGSSPSVDVSQYGAGQIIASALDVGGAINDLAGNPTTAVNPFQFNNGPFCGSPGNVPANTVATGFVNPAAAPTADLRFLSNLISLAGTHPNENKTGRQNAANNDLASFSPAWTFPVTPPTAATANPPPGAAVWGNYVYVTTYAVGPGGTPTGTVHAFDAYPAEFLTAVGQADDGIKDFSASPPTAYDEVWNADVGPNASAPTVASYGGGTHVLVEKADGSVVQFDAVQGTVGTPLTIGTVVTPGPAKYPAQDASGNTLVTNAPAPVVYEGRVFAGQPNSDLLVGPASGGAGLRVPLNPAGTATVLEAVCGSPSVGVLADGNLTNDLVAIVPTTQNVYTVFLGARADLLQPYSTTGYNVNRQRLRLYNLKIANDSNAKVYTYSGANLGPAVNSASSPDFTATQTTGAAYGDYDALLDPATATPSSFSTNQTLNLNSISDFSYGAVTNGTLPSTAVVSAPATDRNGDLYYTVNAGGNSYLFGVHQDPQFQNVKVKFRFRLPKANESFTDGDGLLYADFTNGAIYDPTKQNPMVGYTFVGAPVIDNQGFVYVAAYHPAILPEYPKPVAAVLCFSTTQPIYADVSGAFDPTQATFTQTDEFNGSQPNQLRPGPVDGTLQYGQFSAAGNRVTFYNFGIGTGSPRQIAGNLTEPQPVQATPNPDPNQAQQNLNSVNLALHTNLQWYTTFPINGTTSGLTKVGATVFLTDGTNLYEPAAYPTAITNKYVTFNSTAANNFVPLGTSVGSVAATPSAGTGVMVINGTQGLAALTQQLTLVTDNNRILEVDTQGNAVWGVDATAHLAPTGTTYVDFNHPTSLSQVTPNDYLVADTGNNRCVRFDRAGDVLWELTQFTDTKGILVPGQPLSLNAPTSVQMNRYGDPSPNNVGGTKVSYLIADSGNSRVLEVTDTLDPKGNVISPSHDVTWATHTGDKMGRHYRYGSATYFNVSALGVPASIVAAVTNTRLSSLANGTLGPASGDAPGGSLVIFDYGTSNITEICNSFVVPDSTGATTLPIPIRNPRSLTIYHPPSGALPSFLYADDNGAYDLVYDTVHSLFAVGYYDVPSGMYKNLGLHFTQGDYQNMRDPLDNTKFLKINSGEALDRSQIPFVPTFVQRLNADTVAPKYVITQSYSQSELATPVDATHPRRIGGEVFEVDGNTGIGGFSGATLSRPGLTGPLTQPTSAIRPQQ